MRTARELTRNGNEVMTSTTDISKAKARAKRMARAGGTTHQQALDAIAREAGYDHWADMAGTAGSAPTDRTQQPARGPNHTMPPQLDDFAYMPPPGVEANTANGRVPSLPDLADVERDLGRIMERTATDQATSESRGRSIPEWVADRMHQAAERGLAHAGKTDKRPAIAELPLTTDNVAYAMDPEGGPYEPHDRLTVRCPMHQDGKPPLAIKGELMRCAAGCDATRLRDHLARRLAETARNATDFMVRNDASGVVAGASANENGGGMGGSYTLRDGSKHRMETLTCRLLGNGYPRWDFG